MSCLFVTVNFGHPAYHPAHLGDVLDIFDTRVLRFKSQINDFLDLYYALA